MSREKIIRYSGLIIIFILFVFVVYLFSTYFYNKKEMSNLSKIGYTLIDEINDYRTNNKSRNVENDYKIENGVLNNSNIDINHRLPESGEIIYDNNRDYIIMYDHNYCAYKRFNEGNINTAKVNSYHDCIDLSQHCFKDQTYNNYTCENLTN